MNRLFIFSMFALFIGTGVTSCTNNGAKLKKGSDKITRISDDSLLTLIQYQTFRYFWDGAEPTSGMARERFHTDDVYPENDKNVVTSGGTGFGVMSVLVAIERNFITREAGVERLTKITGFLEKADRFHGAWPHWMFGETGKVKPFGGKDNGGDIVETAYLIQGLICVKNYLKADAPSGKTTC